VFTRLLRVCLATALVVPSVGLAAGPASASSLPPVRSVTATTVMCTDTQCDGRDPIQQGCANNVQTLDTATSGNVEVTLRFSSACWAVWAQLFVFNNDAHYAGDVALVDGFPCSQGFSGCRPSFVAYSPQIDPNSHRWQVYSDMVSFTFWTQAWDEMHFVHTGIH